MVPPGESCEEVDLNDPHQRALVTDGHLTVVDGPTPRKAPDGPALVKASTRNAEAVLGDTPKETT
jgi:hypothetical protein